MPACLGYARHACHTSSLPASSLLSPSFAANTPARRHARRVGSAWRGSLAGGGRRGRDRHSEERAQDAAGAHSLHPVLRRVHRRVRHVQGPRQGALLQCVPRRAASCLCAGVKEPVCVCLSVRLCVSAPQAPPFRQHASRRAVVCHTRRSTGLRSSPNKHHLPMFSFTMSSVDLSLTRGPPCGWRSGRAHFLAVVRLLRFH